MTFRSIHALGLALSSVVCLGGIAPALFSERSTARASAPTFIRGDVDGSGTMTIGDAIGIVNHLFLGGALDCRDAADVTDDGTLDLADPVSLVTYLFSAGAVPAAPFPDCGSDPTDDALDCFDEGPFCSVQSEAPSFLLDQSGQVRRFAQGGSALEVHTPPVPLDQAEWIEVSTDGFEYWLIDAAGSVGRFAALSGEQIASVELGGVVHGATTIEGGLLIAHEIAGTVSLHVLDSDSLTLGPALYTTAERTELHSLTTDDLFAFLSAELGSTRGILRVDLQTGDESWIVTLAPTAALGPVFFDLDWGLVWWVDAQPGVDVRVRGLTSLGDAVFDEVIPGITGPELGDADVHEEWILVPYIDSDELMSFNRLTLSPEVWLDAAQGLAGPIDVSR